MQAFVDKLLLDRDREGALEVVRDAIRRLLSEQVPVEKLVLSKKLAKMYVPTHIRRNRRTDPLLLLTHAGTTRLWYVLSRLAGSVNPLTSALATGSSPRGT